MDIYGSTFTVSLACLTGVPFEAPPGVEMMAVSYTHLTLPTILLV